MHNSDYAVRLIADEKLRVLRFDRSQTELREGDVIRELPLDCTDITLTILADSSSLEVFINHGEKVMTSRVFTPADATKITALGGAINATFYPLNGAFQTYPLS